MRKIKFRAWDKLQEIMVNVDRINFNAEEIDVVVEKTKSTEEFYSCSFDEIELMQYTGLKDRTGTEIYEGDILELINEDNKRMMAICKFGNRRLVTDRGITIDIQCFYFEIEGWKTNPVVSNYKGMHDLEIMEVRGNIYENPELLELRS